MRSSTLPFRPRIAPARRPLLAAVLTVLLGVGAAGLAAELHLTDRAEQQTLDWRWQARGDRHEDPRLAIVAIDDATLARRQETWPPARSLHADAIDAITHLGAVSIVYSADLDLAGPRKADDDAVLDALSNAPSPVLGATGREDDGPRLLGGGRYNRQESGAVFGGDLELRDEDGAERRFQVRDDPIHLPAVPIVAAQVVLHRPVRAPSARPWIDVTDAPCALNDEPAQDGHLRCGIPAYSLGAVLARRVPSTALEDKLVVVGYTGSSQQVLRASWAGGSRLYAATQLTAHEIGTALRGFPLRDAPWWITALMTLLLCAWPAALAQLVTRRLDARVEEPSWALSACRVAAGGLLGIVASWVLAAVLFHTGHVVAVAAPTAGALVATAVAATRTGAQARTRAADIWRTATGLAPDQLLDRVVRDSAGRHLVAGDSVPMTILFADVRDSSTYVDALDRPAEVWRFSQAFMRHAIAAVEDHGGWAQSLEGDGLLAMFAHVEGDPDPAAGAVAAAVALVGEALDAMRADVARDLPDLAPLTAARPIGMRVGVQTGLVHLGVSGRDGTTRARWAPSTVGKPTHQAAKLRAAASFDKRRRWRDGGAALFTGASSDERIAVVSNDTMVIADAHGANAGTHDGFVLTAVEIEGAGWVDVWVHQLPGHEPGRPTAAAPGGSAPSGDGPDPAPASPAPAAP